MTFSVAASRYKEIAGDQYTRPSKGRSYCRNHAWHLLDRDGALLAVVYPSGTVVHGPMLQRLLLAQATGQ